MNSAAARAAVLEARQAMYREGLVVGTAGNVSIRADGHTDAMHITPSRMPSDETTVDDIVTVTFDGDPIEGDRIPSVECLMHGAVYRAREDVRAVVHAHPVFASVLAVRHEEIPPILDEQVVYVGGEVAVSDYAPSATEELAEATVAALGPRMAVLLANHGTLAVGSDPEHALEVTRLVERLAQIWYFAGARPGSRLLPDDVAAAERDIFHMQRQVEIDQWR